MPFETAVVVTLIVIAFGTFLLALLWGQVATGK